MSTREMAVEQICDALWALPDEQLRQVLCFVEDLGETRESDALAADEPVAPLYSIHTAAVRTGVTDLAHQHDHYLYGLDKRDA